MIVYFIGYHRNTDPNSYKVTNIDGKTRPMTTTEIYIGGLIFFVGIMGLLWLIIRYFANKDKK